MLPNPIVAYLDQPSPDPQTGQDGVLRQEWRIRPMKEIQPGALTAAWGPDWTRYHPFADVVLEHRYIRRGVREPWTPYDCANSEEQLLAMIATAAKAVDVRLLRLQQDREKARAMAQMQAEADREARIQKAEAELQKRRADVAWQKLVDSADPRAADAWKTFILAHGQDAAFKERAAADPQFMALHHKATCALAVPSRRRAIFACIAYAEKHLLGGPICASKNHGPRSPAPPR